MAGMVPEKWDIETEVLVVGYGGAGAVAAISAKDAGADVLIIEKTSRGGGNTCISGGNIIFPLSQEFSDYLKTLNFKTADEKIVDMFVAEAMNIGDWIKELGGETTVYMPLAVAYPMAVAGAGFPQVKGAEHMLKYNIKGDAEIKPAQRLWTLLSSNVEKREIKVMTDTPAKDLVKNEKGEIIGVLAESQGKPVAIKARKAVILTTGGFENNEEIKWDNLPCKPAKFIGHPGNTGDGLKMADKAGASMWHMSALTCVIGCQIEGYEAAFYIVFLNPGFIYVDKYGQRFIPESEVETHEFWRSLSQFDTEKLEYPRIPFYAIFDEKVRKTCPISGGTSGYNSNFAYQWSLDNMEEIKKGWITKGNSLAELAGKIGMDAAALEATVNSYNEGCQTGQDPMGRAKENISPIDVPPYYAIKLHPGILNTCGGPKRDIEARVLDADNNPLPRLYSSGELGSVWGFLYQGANSIGESIVFGRIAGRNAAAEEPWS